MHKAKFSPYSFSVIKDGNSYEYRVTRYPSTVILAGGWMNTRKAAEKQARLEIAALERAAESQAA